MSLKRKVAVIVCMILCLSFAGAMTCLAAGEWSKDVTLDVPGWNGSAKTSDLANPVSVTKQTTDTQCTFHVYTNTTDDDLCPDGRLINKDGAARSSWVYNLDTGETKTAEVVAVKGDVCYAEISSDFLEIWTKSISFKFSADDMT